VFLQHSVKVGELLRRGTGGMCLGKEVPLNSIGTDMTSIVIHTRLPKRTCNGSQPFLPCDDGTLSAIQLPLSSKKLCLQFNSHRM
jgi:hypothetical protein